MILSVMPMAFAADYELEFGKKLTVTVNPEDIAEIRFVAPKTAPYVFAAESNGVDTAVYVYDENDNFLDGINNDDTSEGKDFRYEIELEEGTVCYIHVFTYSSETETFDVIAECGHLFDGSACTYCDKVCDHTESAVLGICLCGEVFLGTDIAMGEEYEFKNFVCGSPVWLRFIPEESGAYSLKSFSEDADPDCILYNSDGEYIYQSTDVNDFDFDLISNFEEGETYYIEVYNCNEYDADIKLTFDRINHTAEDGSEHGLDFVEETYSNCTEHGYSAGFYCSICEEFVEGHEEYELDPQCHIDEDWDDACDFCGAEIEYYYGCECLCHYADGFFAFIWRIANFIHSVFGISPECECGDWHYQY